MCRSPSAARVHARWILGDFRAENRCKEAEYQYLMGSGTLLVCWLYLFVISSGCCLSGVRDTCGAVRLRMIANELWQVQPTLKKDITVFMKQGCTHTSVQPRTTQHKLATIGATAFSLLGRYLTIAVHAGLAACASLWTVAGVSAVAFVAFSIFFPLLCMGAHWMHGSG